MRTADDFLAAALGLGVSGTTMAQSNPPPPTPAPPVAPAHSVGLVKTHWTAAGFASSNFGSTSSDVSLENRRSFEYGGQVGHLITALARPTVCPGNVADQVTESLLPGLRLWRTNVGIAFQW